MVVVVDGYLTPRPLRRRGSLWHRLETGASGTFYAVDILEGVAVAFHLEGHGFYVVAGECFRIVEDGVFAVDGEREVVVEDDVFTVDFY